jgi:hypothetical protein
MEEGTHLEQRSTRYVYAFGLILAVALTIYIFALSS